MKNISRTAIFAWIMTVLGLLGTIGVDLPTDQIQLLLERITDDVIALFMLIVGPITLWLRAITSSPLASGLMGLLGKKKESR
jgi:hypothetical protein